MVYARLIDVWPTGGQAAVLFSALEDAGFEPVANGDLRGWMYYRGWPLGAFAPASVWVPQDRLDEARSFLDTAAVPSWDADESASGDGFWYGVSERRRLFYGVWLAFLVSGLVTL